MTTVGILQPSYLPWCGYFEQMARSDLFIHLDNVAYTRQDWRNRNRILLEGQARWLTVPTRRRPTGTPISEIEIDDSTPWQKKHVHKIESAYRTAPHYQTVVDAVFPVLTHPPGLLMDLNLALVSALREVLGIDTPCTLASDYDISYDGKSDRILQLCKAAGATKLYDGKAAEEFLDIPSFEAAGIEVEFQNYRHAEYDQGASSFTPYLSVIDLIAHCGPDAGRLL